LLARELREGSYPVPPCCSPGPEEGAQLLHWHVLLLFGSLLVALIFSYAFMQPAWDHAGPNARRNAAVILRAGLASSRANRRIVA